MFVRIEKGSSVPITRQIAEQIRAQCLCGSIPPGERLPSVRELARELAVNLNTVLRVYERLAAEQLIEMRHGDGTFVLPRPASSKSARELELQREQFGVEFDAMIERGLLLGLEARDLNRHLNNSLKKAGRRFDNPTRETSKSHRSPAPEDKS